MLGRGRQTEPRPLDRTEVAQPAVFAVEYALAQLLAEWGIRPRALLGYSLGEYGAACLAGVLSFEDALTLVARRARLIGGLPPGAMLSVALAEQEAVRFTSSRISLSGLNGPTLSVLSGPPEDMDSLAADLAERGIASRRLPTTHAFHSSMMEPVRDALRELLRGVKLAPPAIPYLSNVTGTWITAEEATDPEHWVRHLVAPVRFGQAMAELLAEPSRVLIEVGPGQGLTTLALQLAGGQAPVAVSTLRPGYERQADEAYLLGGLARLWLAGLPVDWAGFSAPERRRKLRLPTYPFERKRFWIERGLPPPDAAAATELPPPEPSVLARHERPANLRNPYVEPTTERERRLVELWQDLLGVEPIGVHDSFFALGGHSLLAPQLIVRLRAAFGVDFPMRDLFEAPTVAELAQALDLVEREGRAALAAAREVVDLRAEAVLDPTIQPEGPPPVSVDDPAEVFLTGATGFLGAWLAAELLRQTRARVHCLVRAADADEALRRLRASLAERALWRDDLAERLVAVPGDLGEPRFGMSEEAFRELASRVDAVYHNGAWVNFTYPYKVLKPANVLGTVEALRLAALVRTKPFHLVSSITAVPEVEYGFRDDPTVYEDDECESLSGLFGGYGETKWVSEQIAKIARGRGLPVSIYRPTVLSGDRKTGVCNTRDMVWNMIKGCIQMGVTPDGEPEIEITPVDYVAAALIHISLRADGSGRVYQFPHPRQARWRTIFEFMREYGYRLEWMKSGEWERYALERLQTDTENALAPFAPVVANFEAYGVIAEQEGRTGRRQQIHFDDRNVRTAVAGSDIVCPDVDARLLTVYFDHFVATGFLPPPPVVH